MRISFIVLCFFMINIIYIKKVHALPLGVDIVRIDNWTKTREVNEIEDDEKKLNSENIDGIKNINFSSNISEVETFDNLYEKFDVMRDISDVSFEKYKYNEVSIIGNKVLRTKVTTDKKIYSFNYNTIKRWIGNGSSVDWQTGTLQDKIKIWPSYTQVLEEKNFETPIEMRMLEGEFQLNEEQIDLILSKKVQPVLGIESNDNFHLMLPFNDLINIFINEETTELNYRVVPYEYRFNINQTRTLYNPLNAPSDIKYCNKEEHNILSNHTNKKHVDFNILESISQNNYYKMVGDISNYIKKSTQNYKISLLIGQLGRSGEGAVTQNGGTSQVSLFLIENPQFKINIRPYTKKNNEKIYISSDYRFSCNEKILFDMEIINESSNYDYSNLDFTMNLIKEVKADGTKTSDTLEINKKSAKYKNINITDYINVYLNDENISCSINNLSNLKKGDKITISSNKFEYNVTEYNALEEKISYDYTIQFNYLNNYTFYKYKDTNSLNVKPIDGKLTITVNSDSNNCFYLKLEGENNCSNIKVKSNEPYTISNLDYNKRYKLSLINSSTYKSVNSQYFVLENKSNYNKKSITINLDKKINNYFTQRQIDEIFINR